MMCVGMDFCSLLGVKKGVGKYRDLRRKKGLGFLSWLRRPD